MSSEEDAAEADSELRRKEYWSSSSSHSSAATLMGRGRLSAMVVEKPVDEEDNKSTIEDTERASERAISSEELRR